MKMLTRIYKEDKDTLKEYLMSRTQDLSTDVLTTVSNIIQDVKKNQDEACLRYTKQFDKIELDSMEVSKAEWEAQILKCDAQFMQAMKLAKQNIEDFHNLQKQHGYLLQKEMGISYIFIAHDLGMVKHISDRIGVMYLGHIVECGPSDVVYHTPLHPYTQALLSAIPIPDPDVAKAKQRIVLEGEIPSPINTPAGCPFASRCPRATERCRKETPKPVQLGERSVACFLYEK